MLDQEILALIVGDVLRLLRTRLLNLAVTYLGKHSRQGRVRRVKSEGGGGISAPATLTNRRIE